MNDGVNNKIEEEFTMCFNFSDNDKHEISSDILVSYINLLKECCEQNNIKLSFAPFEIGSFKIVAFLIGDLIVLPFLDGAFFNLKQRMQNFGNYVSSQIFNTQEHRYDKYRNTLFKYLKKDINNITSFEVSGKKKGEEEKSYCKIEKAEFDNYIFNDDKEDFKEKKRQEKILKLQEKDLIKEVKISQTKGGEIKIELTDIDKAKIKLLGDFNSIIEKFNEEKEEINLFNRDEKLEKK